jgi:hypothetical protein
MSNEPAGETQLYEIVGALELGKSLTSGQAWWLVNQVKWLQEFQERALPHLLGDAYGRGRDDEAAGIPTNGNPVSEKTSQG